MTDYIEPTELEKLRAENEQLKWLAGQSLFVISELIDGSRRQNVERCNAWQFRSELEAVAKNHEQRIEKRREALAVQS